MKPCGAVAQQDRRARRHLLANKTPQTIHDPAEEGGLKSARSIGGALGLEGLVDLILDGGINLDDRKLPVFTQ